MLIDFMLPRRKLPLIWMLVPFLLTAQIFIPAYAQTPQAFEDFSALLAGHEVGSLDDAVALVKKTMPGRILSAQTVTSNGITEYHIRILTEDQRVRTLVIDAHSGEWR